MKELLEFVTRSLVDKTNEVQVRELESNQARIFELSVAKEDLGKIIGKQGRTARALRLLVSAASSRAKKRLLLEIIE